MLSKIRETLAKSNAALLIAYVLFVIFPHFAAISHSHPGGDRPHTHGFLSLHDETLKRQILTTLGDASGFKTVSMPVSTREEVLPPLISLEAGARGLHSANFWHIHFQEDPNLLAWALLLDTCLFVLLLRTRSALRKQALPELAALRAVAAGRRFSSHPPLNPRFLLSHSRVRRSLRASGSSLAGDHAQGV